MDDLAEVESCNARVEEVVIAQGGGTTYTNLELTLHSFRKKAAETRRQALRADI